MELETEKQTTRPRAGNLNNEISQSNEIKAGQLHVLKRDNKTVVPFDAERIAVAISKAFIAVEGSSAATSRRIHEKAAELTAEVTNALSRHLSISGVVHIEDIQDQVERLLMRTPNLEAVAKEYILYRRERNNERDSVRPSEDNVDIRVTLEDGKLVPIDIQEMNRIVNEACKDLEEVDAQLIVKETLRNIYDGVKIDEVRNALIMSARTKIEIEPNYSYVAARLLLNNAFTNALHFLSIPSYSTTAEMSALYPQALTSYIKQAAKLELVDSKLLNFDLDKLGKALDSSRDYKFNYLGLQTLYDRYFIHSNETRIELPQVFFMRVAMGLAMEEKNKNEKAIEFYNLLSSFDFMSSTPTLFNSGTLRPQLSSCFLLTVEDNLFEIFGNIRDNAMLSKFAGGLGNDWTKVRSMGSHIKGTNGKSQGVVPFLKVANDTAVAVNQGGKRKGAMCSYLESWHLDIEEFLDLRKNTGDDRRRTHDMNTANWIPDLFMKRVIEKGDWTLFSPSDTPELHETFGHEFEELYVSYEKKADKGEIKDFKRLPAINLWRKMLGMLFETGHPWVTFKDPCNLRSPQQHAGVVHSSNLCTEITLNTSADEVAVCNLGSINLVQHLDDNNELDAAKLEKTVNTAIRMLDNVIDINYYSIPQARRSNLRHRPIGMGIMGFQDVLYKKDLAYTSNSAVEFADKSMELISYYAITASNNLAKERGSYASFEGSLWSKGILPIDSVELLAGNRENGKYLDLDRSKTLDWDSLREKVKANGMRNSNVLAIAPTATIANICGVTSSIEPCFQNLFVKSNLSGEFTMVNPYLVEDLKKLGIWDQVIVNDLKYFNGSVQQIDRIPNHLKEKYANAFEVGAIWLIDAAARRQKWIDQAQSLNIYIDKPSGKVMDTVYKHAWLKGLKTTYYCRTLGATNTEKSTLDRSVLNAVKADDNAEPKMCAIDDPECEACQ